MAILTFLAYVLDKPTSGYTNITSEWRKSKKKVEKSEKTRTPSKRYAAFSRALGPAGPGSAYMVFSDLETDFELKNTNLSFFGREMSVLEHF